MYDDFGALNDWLSDNKVILLVDELNTLLVSSDRYIDMCALLDRLAGAEGSALIYSTHQRATKHLIKGPKAWTPVVSYHSRAHVAADPSH
jgi:hypothetical protein